MQMIDFVDHTTRENEKVTNTTLIYVYDVFSKNLKNFFKKSLHFFLAWSGKEILEYLIKYIFIGCTNSLRCSLT